MTNLAHKRMSAAEYLAFERASETKHQFFDGEVFAMAGGSYVHNLISRNVLTRLTILLAGKPCEPLGSDQRVTTPRGLYTYPDVTVHCGPPEFVDENSDTLTNPRLLVEVLSPSTERYDRGKKFEQYREVRTLTDYVIVSQDRASVDHFFRREAEGPWLLIGYSGLEARVAIDNFEIVLPLSEIYAGVDFAAAEPDPPPPLRPGATF